MSRENYSDKANKAEKNIFNAKKTIQLPPFNRLIFYYPTRGADMAQKPLGTPALCRYAKRFFSQLRL